MRRMRNFEDRLSTMESNIDWLKKVIEDIGKRMSSDTIPNIYNNCAHETIRGEVNAIKKHLDIYTQVIQSNEPKVVARTRKDDLADQVAREEARAASISAEQTIIQSLRKNKKGKK